MTVKKKQPEIWSAITCLPSKENAGLMRDALDELGLKYHRDKEERSFSRVMVVIPMPQFAYVFKFIIEDPEFEISIYDTRPTHSALLHHVEVKYLNRSNIKTVKKVLKAFSKKMPRKPYKFFIYERIKTGYLWPEYLTARGKWKQMGVK